MFEWLDSVAGPGYTAAVLWTFAALVLLVIVLVIVKLVRSLTFGTFVSGGRNRKTRLAVMDATAVDSHRRLVLVRRDDIEHLLLIGGPTDVVVERDIRIAAPKRPALTGAEAGQDSAPPPRQQAHVQHAASRPPAAHPVRSPAPAQAAPAVQRPAPPRPQAPAPVASPVAPVRPQVPVNQQAPANHLAAKPAPAQVPAPSNEIDDALMKELEVSLDKAPPAKPATDASLDDEMARLLGELSSHKK